MKKVACLGPIDSHSYQAALELPGSPEIVTLSQFALMEAIVSAEFEAVIPIENADGGWVSWVISSLLDIFEVDDYPLSIVSEKTHMVRHVLCGIGSLVDICKVFSHEQALLQCRRKIRGMRWEAVSADSTSKAAEMVSQRNDKEIAAIATKEAADRVRLRIIDSDFVTSSTRFIFLQRGKARRTGNDKTFVMVTLHDQVGALDNVIKIFAQRGINMKMIHSSPYMGEYIFFMEIEGHEEDYDLANALGILRRDARGLKIFGSFPRAQNGNGWSVA